MLRSLVAAIAALIAVPASAADKGGPAPAPAVVAEPAPAQAFHGLYIGAVAGHSAGTLNDAEGFKLPREGYTVGGLIGYNHRLPGFVLGGEIDLSVLDVSGSTNAGGFTVSGSSKVLASARARLGIPLGHTLLYGTAGMAVTNGKLAVDDIGANERNRINGWVAGAGIESMLFGNMGVRIEALRFQWDDKAFVIDGQDTGKLRSHDTHVRAGLVFKLN